MATKIRRQVEPDPETEETRARPGVGEAQRRKLLALGREMDQSIARPVVELVRESRELERIAERQGQALLQQSRLDPRVLASLGERRETIELAEAAWLRHRLDSLPPGLRALRVEAEDCCRDVLAALGYFMQDDRAVQEAIAELSIGGSLVDLAQALRTLSRLVEQAGRALLGAALPRGIGERMRKLAALFAAQPAADREGALLLSLRNRAFWHLVDGMDQICAAGRWVFRAQPLTLSLFRPPLPGRPRAARARASSRG